MRKILLTMLLVGLGFQAQATDDGLRQRRVGSFSSELTKPVIMNEDLDNGKIKKERLEALACQSHPGCMTDLRSQLLSAGWRFQKEHLPLLPDVALAANHGDVVLYLPEWSAEYHINKALEKAEALQRHFLIYKTPPLDPETMAFFPGDPNFLKLPGDVFRGLFLKILDRRSAGVLRRCNKTLYSQITQNQFTAEYFLKHFQSTGGPGRVINYYQSLTFNSLSKFEHLSGAVSELKALEWFKDQGRDLDMGYFLKNLEDYEYCPRVFLDRGYWRLKNKYNFDSAHKSDWGRKLILATHGGDNIGSLMWFGLKTSINVSLILAHCFLLEGKPLVLPNSCQQVFGFPRGSFLPSILSTNLRFNWILPYRNMSVTIPFMALLFKDIYMLASSYHAPLGDKERLIDLRGRWPVWNRDFLPQAWQKDELALVAFATAFWMFYHPLLITWAVPLTGPVQNGAITFGDFTSLITRHTSNSTWMNSCCMMVDNYVQPHCIVPWVMDAAQSITTYSIEQIPGQWLAGMVNIAPMFIAGFTWTFYYMVVRGMF